MESWLDLLSARVEALRRTPRADRVLFLLDADGVLLDPRPAVLDRLHDADRRAGREDFADLRAADFEGQPVQSALAARLGGERLERAQRVLGPLLEPELGAGARAALLDLLRWLQLHPGSFVALRSARDEARAAATLAEVRRNTQGMGLRFSEDLLLLGPADGQREAGLAGLLERGFALAATLDAHLAQPGDAQRDGAPLAFDRQRLLELPTAGRFGAGLSGAVRPPVPLNARGLCSRDSLATLLGSSASGVEVEIGSDPRGELFLRGAPAGEAPIAFEELLGMLAQGEKSLVLDLGSCDTLMPRALLALTRSGFRADRVAICAPAARWRDSAFRGRVGDGFAAAVLRASVRAADGRDEGADSGLGTQLDQLASLGIGRIGVEWDDPRRDEVLAIAAGRGLDADLACPRSLPALLSALAQRPAAVTCELPQGRAPDRLEQPAAPFAVRSRSAMRA